MISQKSKQPERPKKWGVIAVKDRFAELMRHIVNDLNGEEQEEMLRYCAKRIEEGSKRMNPQCMFRYRNAKSRTNIMRKVTKKSDNPLSQVASDNLDVLGRRSQPPGGQLEGEAQERDGDRGHKSTDATQAKIPRQLQRNDDSATGGKASTKRQGDAVYHDTNPAKRRKPSSSRTEPDEVIEHLTGHATIRTEKVETTPRAVVEGVIQVVQRSLFYETQKAEITTALTLIGRIVGDEGAHNFRELYREYHQATAKGRLVGTATAKRCDEFANALGEIGCPTFSGIFRSWGSICHVFDNKPDPSSLGRCQHLRQLWAYAELVRGWEATNIKHCVKNAASDAAIELQTLLASTHFREYLQEHPQLMLKGVKRQDQLTSYIADQLKVNKKIFTTTVIRYKPLSILAARFGPGILAFLPKANLLSLCNSLHVKAGSKDAVAPGEQLFNLVITTADAQLPGFKELCNKANNDLVAPIISGRPLPTNFAASLLEAGRIKEFKAARPWELLAKGSRGVARVAEIQENGREEAGQLNRPAGNPVAGVETDKADAADMADHSAGNTHPAMADKRNGAATDRSGRSTSTTVHLRGNDKPDEAAPTLE